MEDVTRKRIMRLLEGLPEERLYQVLDYIEFLELKEARQADRKPDPFQRFAERVEDQMRLRSVAPKAMKGTMRLMSTAGRVLDGVRELGQDVVGGLDRPPRDGQDRKQRDGQDRKPRGGQDRKPRDGQDRKPRDGQDRKPRGGDDGNGEREASGAA
jgi:hypothetical protein